MKEVAVYDITAKMWLGRFPETKQSLHDAKARVEEDKNKGHILWIVYYNNQTPQEGMIA